MDFGNEGLLKKLPKEDYLELGVNEIVRNLNGLVESLRGMNAEIFSQYVTKSHNDFSEWILEAYGDEKLARKVGRTRRKEKMIKIIENAIKKSPRIQKILVPRKKREILNLIGRVKDEV